MNTCYSHEPMGSQLETLQHWIAVGAWPLCKACQNTPCIASLSGRRRMKSTPKPEALTPNTYVPQGLRCISCETRHSTWAYIGIRVSGRGLSTENLVENQMMLRLCTAFAVP